MNLKFKLTLASFAVAAMALASSPDAFATSTVDINFQCATANNT
jgi:hypothetical protein